ncbi:MAG: hypothetical protein C5B52_00410, partial [Bacteroidetes bacterium]
GDKSNAVKALQKDIPTLMKDAQIPGLSIALIENGRIIWEAGYGVSNADTRKPVTRMTIFEAASLTKVVTCYTVLKLVDQGKINLDTPLNKYLGNNYDVVNDDRINLITARRVLTHSAGFPNWRNDGSKTLPINFNPGERFSYSGEGFVYLSRVAEKLTGMKFEDLVKRTVLEPLGMTSSNFTWVDSYKEIGAYRHDWSGKVSFRNEGRDPNAAASLRTTAEDYAKFMIAIMNGTGLKESTWNEMLKPQIAVNEKTAPGVDWGLGVGLEITSGVKDFWHWGDQGDSKCYMTGYPDSKNGVVYFTNSNNGLSIVREILKDALGGPHPAPDWLNYEKFNPALPVFYQAVLDKGAKNALDDYHDKLSKKQIQPISESSLNSIGYVLLREKKIDDAILIFTENTKVFPESSNAWDSLAEGYMNKGENELAIKYYQKSLALNPDNNNATEMIKKIQSGNK